MPPRDYYLPERRLASQDDAAIVEDATVPRSRFTGPWTRKMTFNAGPLYPFMVEEILPGDHMRYTINAYVRMATPLFPVMDNQRIDTFLFFIPMRLVWDNFPKFMGEQDNPTDSINFTIPKVQRDQGSDPNSLADHMGIPNNLQVTPGTVQNYNALPFRAYNACWNQWFRDQNSQNSVFVDKNDAPRPMNDYVLLNRNKAHDYFTSALPWPQKFTAPTVPIAGLAPVLGIGTATANANVGPLGGIIESNQTVNSYAFYKQLWNTGVTNETVMKMTGNGGLSYPAVFADLGAVSGVAINQLRQAWLVQGLLERDARGGTRYTELVWNHFKVRNPDFRLQRPEYIGGGQTGLHITPVAQTAPTAGAPVGVLGAAGTAAGVHSASYAATEHGYILGLINVRSELSYSQGLHPMWTRETRYDFPWPSLAGLGEQAILRREIYMTGAPANDLTVFGYQERWQEWRTRYNEITGMFRPLVAGTLDAWHLAQTFGSAPVLGSTFLADTPPMSRILAAGVLANNQQYLADIMIERTAVRAIPMFGTPALMGRF